MTEELFRDEFTEPERYELHEAPSYRFELERREFVQILGAGILISMVGNVVVAQQARRRGGGGTIAERLHIGADGVITVMTSKVEVGQGSRTQLTMAAAEELRVPVGQIRLVMADSSLVPNDGGTAGSRTTPSTVPRVRRACAAARELLLETAGKQWSVAPASLSVTDGKILRRSGDQVFSYADLVAESVKKGLEREIQSGIAVSAVAEWKVLGTPVPKVGGAAIVTGAHRYPSDIVRPGMLYGKVLRPPSYGATLSSIDLGPARSMAGVTAVRDGEFVGCAAPTSAKAVEALEAASASARWETPAHPSSEGLYAHLKEHARSGSSSSRRRRRGARNRGSLDEGLAASKKVLRATYVVAYVQHAPMEPRTAVAEWNGEGLTVWTGTQQPPRVRSDLARVFRVPEEKVRVIVPDTGGGFGGKHSAEAAVEAARLSRAARRPVSLTWTREEEFTWAYFRPAGVIELAGGLAGDGSVTAWEHINYNSGSSAISTPYAIPNTRTQFKYCESPLRQGSYRALASTANVFARESFMDELAAVAGADPLEFRLRQLEAARLRAVLEGAARRFDWARRKKERRKDPEGSKVRGIGLACGTEKGSFAAACVEIEVDRKSGRFKVVEVCEAYECGAIQNPKNLKAQVDGCIIQGLGAALKEEIHFKDGRIVNPSFSTYEVPRLKEVPKIETVLLDRPDLPSLGAGETPIIAVAPAIGNALFAATGVRIRSMPLRNEAFRAV